MPIAVAPRLTTAEELYELPRDGNRYDLFRGSLRMMSPAGGRHGRLASRISWLLSNHVIGNDLGVVFAAETGFRIAVDPDTVLAPDVAFVEATRYCSIENEIGYLPLAPDLAVEVLSPNDRFTRVEAKAMAWLDAGCKLVLVFDSESETVHAYRSRRRIEIFQKDETLDCTDAVTGWKIAIEEFFK